MCNSHRASRPTLANRIMRAKVSEGLACPQSQVGSELCLSACSDSHQFGPFQKTGASLRNIRPSSAATHLATVLAAATAADLVIPGERVMYSSNGLVI
jgi:hypothetical protein